MLKIKNFKLFSKLFHSTKSIVKSLSLYLADKIKCLIKIEYLSFMCVVVATVSAVVTTFVSHMQWNAMQEQLTEMKIARKSEQRPYIVHSLQDNVIEPNKKISFNVTAANYGKSPAMSISRFVQVFYGANAQKNTNEWFEQFGEKPIDLLGNSIIPSTDGNAFIYLTVESDTVLNLKEYDDYKKGAYPIIVVVKEYFSDISGNGYSTETAISWLPNNALQVIRNNTSKL